MSRTHVHRDYIPFVANDAVRPYLGSMQAIESATELRMGLRRFTAVERCHVDDVASGTFNHNGERNAV